MAGKDKVLVANGQGFWGDSILGPIRLLREGPLDYLTLDYLAEVTMSIMQKLHSRDPSKGYATDFVKLIDRVLPELLEKNVRVVANAGGVNPHGCKDALMAVLEKHGVKGVKVAVVEGDDIMGDRCTSVPVDTTAISVRRCRPIVRPSLGRHRGRLFSELPQECRRPAGVGRVHHEDG
ncbi:MAG: acyclic terpene utilization AtuA family protein [Planctomycetota bacterium]